MDALRVDVYARVLVASQGQAEAMACASAMVATGMARQRDGSLAHWAGVLAAVGDCTEGGAQ